MISISILLAERPECTPVYSCCPVCDMPYPPASYRSVLNRINRRRSPRRDTAPLPTPANTASPSNPAAISPRTPTVEQPLHKKVRHGQHVSPRAQNPNATPSPIPPLSSEMITASIKNSCRKIVPDGASPNRLLHSDLPRALPHPPPASPFITPMAPKQQSQQSPPLLERISSRRHGLRRPAPPAPYPDRARFLVVRIASDASSPAPHATRACILHAAPTDLGGHQHLYRTSYSFRRPVRKVAPIAAKGTKILFHIPRPSLARILPSSSPITPITV